MHHPGDLIITPSNAASYAALTNVDGNIVIDAANASLPALTSVGGTLVICAADASLPALTNVDENIVIDAANASLPALTNVDGNIVIDAANTSLPALTSVGGRLDIRAVGASLPATQPDRDLGQALAERDAAEDYIDTLLDLILGPDRPEWSTVYGRGEALCDVEEKMVQLAAQPPTSKYPLVRVGWQQRYIDPEEGPTIWQFCDDRTAEILSDRSDYELRHVFAQAETKEQP